MKHTSKKMVIILLIIILGISSIVRIVYVNKFYPSTKTHSYKVGEMFDYNGFQIKVVETNIYTANDMKEEYKEIPEEVMDEHDIVIKLEIKNCINDEREFSVSSFTMQDGIEPGGVTNPYLYQYLNPDQGGILTLEKASEQTVILAFPTERIKMGNDGKLKLILALYPEKYEINL